MPAAPFLRKMTLFSAGEGGYAIYRIPGIVATPAGSLLACCEARRSQRGDWGTIDVLLRRSTDGGLSWSEAVRMNPTGLIAPRNPAALAQQIGLPDDHTFNNPVLIAGHRPGEVHFVFCAEYARCYYRRSRDDGLTWTEPVDITPAFEELRPRYDWQVIAAGPGHGIALAEGPHAGRLIVPVWISDGTGGHAHRPSAVTMIYSDDGGECWHTGEIVVDNGPLVANPSETMAVELAGGGVWLNLRNESPFHRRVIAFSADGVTGWSEPRPDPALFEPVCAAGLARLQVADGARWLLFSNPDSHADGDPGPGRVSWKRKNLTVRLSEDDGQNWPFARVLAAGLAGYSDLTAAQDGTITCFYEGGGLDGDQYATQVLTIAQFNLAWIQAGSL